MKRTYVYVFYECVKCYQMDIDVGITNINGGVITLYIYKVIVIPHVMREMPPSCSYL